jgi:hypothetical protein
LWLRGRNQSHHLRVQQFLQRAVGKSAEAGIEHDHHHAKEQRERHGNRDQ